MNRGALSIMRGRYQKIIDNKALGSHPIGMDRETMTLLYRAEQCIEELAREVAKVMDGGTVSGNDERWQDWVPVQYRDLIKYTGHSNSNRERKDGREKTGDDQ